MWGPTQNSNSWWNWDRLFSSVRPTWVLYVPCFLAFFERDSKIRFTLLDRFQYYKANHDSWIIKQIPKWWIVHALLQGLIDAARGFHLKDPFGIEQEIVLIWVTYIPLVLNPVIYFSFLSEYRRGTIGVLAKCCGCRVPVRIRSTGSPIRSATTFWPSCSRSGSRPDFLTRLPGSNRL